MNFIAQFIIISYTTGNYVRVRVRTHSYLSVTSYKTANKTGTREGLVFVLILLDH